MAALETGAGRGGAMPLSFIIIRYFIYAFAAVAATWVLCFAVLSASMNAGLVYEASWGPANAREVAGRLAGLGDLDPEEIPTAFRYLTVNGAGDVVETDLDGAKRDRAGEMARAALSAELGDVEVVGGGSGLTFTAFPLSDGGACVLVSEYLPQWVSRGLAELLPNPQNIMLVCAAVGSALSLALVARRASRVIARKMAPLIDAAARVASGELDFAVGHVNVREVMDVLDAMDAMRISLAESLEARWAAERTQRDQMASLAHDLKTPLTVLRANADYIAEELGGGAVPGGDSRGDLAAAARDIADATERLDGYVLLLIEASRGSLDGGGSGGAPVRPAEFCARVVAEAGPVARARGVRFSAAIDPNLTGAPKASIDCSALARAVANLVSNAVEHACSSVELSCSMSGGELVIEVADDGAGFSPAALERGYERFFTDDVSRSACDGNRHYGLGLPVALEAARAHRGVLSLSNRPRGGAVAVISIPLVAI